MSQDAGFPLGSECSQPVRLRVYDLLHGLHPQSQSAQGGGREGRDHTARLSVSPLPPQLDVTDQVNWDAEAVYGKAGNTRSMGYVQCAPQGGVRRLTLPLLRTYFDGVNS